MCKRIPLQKLLVIVFIFLSYTSWSQQDSLIVNDSTRTVVDSAAIRDSIFQLKRITAEADSIFRLVQTGPKLKFDSLVFSHHQYYPFKNPIRRKLVERRWEGKEVFFYCSIALLVFFALIKNAFPRYLQDILKLFFRTSIRQRQIKEQLMQTPLPSLLLNILFVLTCGVYIALVLEHYKIADEYPYWILFIYSSLGIASIYLVKYLVLKLMGWIFRVSDATDTYIFIVFTTNKILGIAFLLFIILLAFTDGAIKQGALSLSFIVIGTFILYRFFLAFMALHRQIKMEFLHFILYLLAFEVVPLLLINKLLLRYLS